MCSQCPERTSRAENRDWDSFTVASFERTHLTVCSLKNSPCTEARPFGNIAIILKDHLCFSFCFSLSPSLLPLPFLLKQEVRPLGNCSDVFKEAFCGWENSVEKPSDESVVTEGGGIKVKYQHVPACVCVYVSFVHYITYSFTILHVNGKLGVILDLKSVV